jgi:hypothetical protein
MPEDRGKTFPDQQLAEGPKGLVLLKSLLSIFEPFF